MLHRAGRRLATRVTAGLAAVIGVLLIAPPPAAALDLTIGRATEQNSLDPLFSDLGNDVATAENMFDSLIRYDAKLRIEPALALSWRLLDPLTWEIRLRPGVRFHDGSAFGAEDVAYSLHRARSVPNSPGPLASFVRPVQSVEAVDPLTLHIHTVTPTPLLMDLAGRIFIVPARLGPTVATEDFNAGRAMIGTGAYRFRSAIPGDRVTMTANPDSWDGPPAFQTLTLRFLANAASRSAALLSGAVDVIEQIPPSDLAAFQGHDDITLVSAVTTRLVYLAWTRVAMSVRS
jgi:peptide/nickel transport system substrate-binding protein